MLSEEMLINVTPQEIRVAVLEQGVVQEIHIERETQRGLVGNVYLGRVRRVLPGMQSAFIEIGLERAAFLHVADILEFRLRPENARPIEKTLFEGQSLLVQVIKDPIGSKGARLSTQISIAGRFLVYLPLEKHIGVSQKIDNEEEREALRRLLVSLIPAEESGGYIIRTNAETATAQELVADIQYLRRQWQNISQSTRSAAPQTLLYQELNLPLRMLRDFVSDHTTRVWVDSGETFDKMKAFAQQYVTTMAERITRYQGERPLFEQFNVDAEIERALSRRVNLKFGGYLIIDQTEALTSIDVNTGGFVGGRSFDDTIFKTNLEAAHAIARQLRLRNLGGIIIVDFIDMENVEHRDAVLQEFRKHLLKDRTRTSISGFTSLGLIEMTRKRTRESLAHILCEACPVCQGRGEVKTAQTVCYEILREVIREARRFNAREFRILAAQSVIDMFLDEESQGLAQLIDFIGKPVSLQVESQYFQEQYDVILL